MTDTLQSLPAKGKVREASLPLASTRSFFVEKSTQAPLQSQAQEVFRLKSGSTPRDEHFLEEMERIRGNQTEDVVLENTYRVAPDPSKKFSSGMSNVFLSFHYS